MFNAYENVRGNKRVKISEFEEEREFNEAETIIYEQGDFYNFAEKTKAQVKIKVHTTDNSRTYTSMLPKKQDESLFVEINKQLQDLSKEFNYTIDEIHTFWMEAWWDIEELKKVLRGEKNRQWSTIEDLALQSDPGSQEYEYIKKSKAQDSIQKRKKFLEID